MQEDKIRLIMLFASDADASSEMEKDVFRYSPALGILEEAVRS